MTDTKRFVPFSFRLQKCDLTPETFKIISKGKYSNEWCGMSMLKSCFEQVMYERLLWELQPQTVLELGSFHGASAMWMGHLCQAMKLPTKIYSVDVDTDQRSEDAVAENVVFLQGDLNNEKQALPKALLQNLPHPWLVIDDAHVNMVPLFNHIHEYTEPGDYIIWEDTNPFSPHTFIGDDFHCEGFCGVGEPKLRELQHFMKPHDDDYMVDAKYADMFGYNVSWNMNSVLKRI